MAGSSESTYGAVSVGGTAEIIADSRARRESIVIKNYHATQVLFLGNDSSVTSSNGLPLAAGDSIRLETKGAIWGIGSGAATDTRFFEEF